LLSCEERSGAGAAEALTNKAQISRSHDFPGFASFSADLINRQFRSRSAMLVVNSIQSGGALHEFRP